MMRAVLFDVGGPLDTEVIYERLIDQHIREALAAEGIAVSDAEYAEAERRTVESFAWNAYQTIIWHLSRYRVGPARRAYAALVRRAAERHAARDGFEVREGMADALKGLAERGLLLGLAANQPLRAIGELERFGLGQYFRHREVSAHHGYYKPDVRLFLRACAELGVSPGECIMVGDRIDNDVVPARMLGMRAILFRTGRHSRQQPRSWAEAPDAEVWDAQGLLEALDRLSSDV